MYRCFIIWDARWRIIAFPALLYLASSGALHLIPVIPLAEWLLYSASGSSRFFLCSALDHHAGGVCHAWHILAGRQAYPPRRAVDLAERGLECHRHFDDLLPSPANAGTNARDTLA